MTELSGTILLGASLRLGPAGPPCRAFKIAPGNFVDGACRREGRGTGTGLRKSSLRAVLAAAVLFAGSAGWAGAATLHVKLAGSHEVPAVSTKARGSAVIVVKRDGAVSGTISTYFIKGTMAHIHEGAPGTEGPPIITLAAGSKGTWVVPQGSKLTPHQYQEFLAGQLYVNVHSAAHPGGEIRGQLTP